jgi:iron complex outermembrane receptor protein
VSNRFRPATCGSLLLAFGIASTQGQESNQAADTIAPALQEVVVTAQKRVEDVREVPVSISVLGADVLRRTQIADYGDLSQSVPGLSFSSQGGPGLSTLELRGISSAAGSATVGIYLDEVPVTIRNLLTIGNTEPHFFDVNRIEVLRGPQGTLYGSSSEGGTIRFISNRPDSRNWSGESNTDLSWTQHGGVNFLGSGVLNVPLIEGSTGLRVGVLHESTSGFIDQVSPITGGVLNSGINSDRTDVVRVTLESKPSPDLTITPALFFQRVQADDTDAYYLNPYTNPATGTLLPLGRLQTAKLVREPSTDTLAVPSVTVNYDAGFADVTSVTSYFYRGFNRVQDGTVGDSVYFGGVLSAAGYNGNSVSALPGYIFLNTQNRAYTQELRLASKEHDGASFPLTWLAGLYYSNQKTSVSDNEPIPGITATVTQLTGLPPSDPRIFGLPFPEDSSYFSLRHYEQRELSVFGDASYPISPGLKLSAGVRYQIARLSLDRVGDYFFNGGYSYDASSSRDHAITPRASITFDVSSESTVYGTVSKGYRLGGPNRPVPASVCAADLAALNLTAAPGSYNSDHLWNYELGSKSRLLNDRLSVNAAVYYIKWSQIQQDVYLNTCGYDFFQNVGSATSYGGELEMKGYVTQHLSLTVAGAYTHATFSQAVPSLGVRDGDPVEGSPIWNASLTAEYAAPITSEVNGFVLANYRGTGSSHGALDPTNPDYLRPSYRTLNANVGFQIRQWEFSFEAKNLLNQQTTIQRPNIQSVVEGITLRPRTLGLAVSTKF